MYLWWYYMKHIVCSAVLKLFLVSERKSLLTGKIVPDTVKNRRKKSSENILIARIQCRDENVTRLVKIPNFLRGFCFLIRTASSEEWRHSSETEANQQKQRSDNHETKDTGYTWETGYNYERGARGFRSANENALGLNLGGDYIGFSACWITEQYVLFYSAICICSSGWEYYNT